MNEMTDDNAMGIEREVDYAALIDGLLYSVSDEALESAGGVMTGQMTDSSSNSSCCP